MLVGRSIVLAHGVRADGSSLSAVVEKLQTASLDWRDSPFVSTLSAISVEIGRPESIDRLGEPLNKPRESILGYCGPVLRHARQAGGHWFEPSTAQSSRGLR